MLTNILEVQNRNLNQWVKIARQIQLVSGVQKVDEKLAQFDARNLYDMFNLVNIR